MKSDIFPVGKLPKEYLSKVVQSIPILDPRVILGPGVGLDCAVVEIGETCLVFKSEPITFATDNIGWYAVQIAVNDVATTGAVPRWMLLTALLPEGKTNPSLVAEISEQVARTCQEMQISLIGGHTEITHGLDRPILVTTMIGEVVRGKLITPKGIRAGDVILLTKGTPIEATALIAHEFKDELALILSKEELLEAQNYLYQPGISVLSDAQIALRAGEVHGMHDPTEGGIITALWEMAEAANMKLAINLEAIPVSEVSKKITDHYQLDPLGTIASGALLMSVSPESADRILEALTDSKITASIIGVVETGPASVIHQHNRQPIPSFERDEIGKIFENPQITS